MINLWDNLFNDELIVLANKNKNDHYKRLPFSKISSSEEL